MHTAAVFLLALLQVRVPGPLRSLCNSNSLNALRSPSCRDLAADCERLVKQNWELEMDVQDVSSLRFSPHVSPALSLSLSL